MSTSTTLGGRTILGGVLRDHSLPTGPPSHHPHHRATERPHGGYYLRAACTLLLMAANMAGQISPVPLGTASTYGALAGDTITNTGATTINGDLGLYPGTSVTGSPTVNGTTNLTNDAASLAKGALNTAFLNAQGRTDRK